MLGPGNLTTHLADLGADVIKVEPPQGDYGRRMTWPIVEGVSLLFLHISRGKKSIVLDLRTDTGRDTFLELVNDADAVVEAMRPGGLDRRGLGFDALRKVNPAHRVLHDLRLRRDRPVPRHAEPRHRVRRVGRHRATRRSTTTGSRTCPSTCRSASTSVRSSARSGLLAGVVRARETGEGCQIEIAQSDAAAAIDWLRSETWRAYERPESEVTGNEADNFERRAPGTGGMEAGVRYQFYATTDGHILFMASEREFWKNFCEGIGRPELFERWPGSQYGDHARGNTELRVILRDVFATEDDAGVARVRARAQHADRAREHAEDALRRPAVPGPLRPAARGAGRRRHARRRRSSSSTRRCRCRRRRRPSASTPSRCCATCSAGTTSRSPRPAPRARSARAEHGYDVRRGCASPARTGAATRRARSAGGLRWVPTIRADTAAPAGGSRGAASTAPTTSRCLPRS